MLARFIAYSTILCSTLSLLSCGSQRTVDKHITRWDKGAKRKIHYLSNAAARRGTVIIYNDSGVQMISEPPPDVALTLATTIINKLSYQGVEDSAMIGVVQGVVELGQRTATVNILRDALYKLSELRMNNSLDSNTIMLFREILKTAETIAQTDRAKASTDSVTAKTEAIKTIDESEKKLEVLKNAIPNDNNLESDKAEDLELYAFRMLIVGNIEDSQKALAKLEKEHKGYKNAYELSNYLKNKTEGTSKVLYQTILEKYSWKMPKTVKDYMEYYIQVK